MEGLFARLDRAITAAGCLAMSGQIADVEPLARHRSERQWRGLVAAPRQRNTDAEKAAIKAGASADEIWPDKPAKARQKDVDAAGGRRVGKQSGGLFSRRTRFAKERPAADGKPQIDIAIPTFGYKSHISIDRRRGIIRRGLVTDAAAHDGAPA